MIIRHPPTKVDIGAEYRSAISPDRSDPAGKNPHVAIIRPDTRPRNTSGIWVARIAQDKVWLIVYPTPIIIKTISAVLKDGVKAATAMKMPETTKLDSNTKPFLRISENVASTITPTMDPAPDTATINPSWAGPLPKTSATYTGISPEVAGTISNGVAIAQSSNPGTIKLVFAYLYISPRPWYTERRSTLAFGIGGVRMSRAATVAPSWTTASAIKVGPGPYRARMTPPIAGPPSRLVLNASCVSA